MSRLVAYHGTTETRADNIIASSYPDISKTSWSWKNKNYHWLGNGAYFFANAPRRAYEWGEHLSKREADKPAVVGAIIELGECLNLMDVEWFPLIEQVYQDLEKEFLYAGKELPHQVPINLIRDKFNRLSIYRPSDFGLNYLDYMVVERAIQYVFKVKSVAIQTAVCAFIEGTTIYDKSFIFDRNHVQLVVRDVAACVKDIWREH